MTLKMTAIGEACLFGREGRRLTAYLDSQGVCTIGDGFTTIGGKPVTRGMTITSAECDAEFERQIVGYAAVVERAIKVPLADHEAAALISICWNIGKGGFAGSTFVRQLNARAPASEIRAAIMMWTKNPELLSRRQAEADQFATPYQTALPRARSTDKKTVAAVPAPVTPLAPHPATTAPAIVPVRLPAPTGWLARFGAWFDHVMADTTPSDLAARG